MAKFKWETSAFIKEKEDVAALAVKKVCSFLAGDIKRSMQPGDHRPWPSEKGDGSIHWSAAPGKAPAPDTGALRDSISFATSEGSTGGLGPKSDVGNVGIPFATPNEIKGVVGTQDEKGLWLEMGVMESNVAPRPFIRTAIPRSKDIIESIFKNTMKRKA